MFKFRVTHISGAGHLLASREFDTPEAIAAQLAPDYLDDIQSGCAMVEAGKSPWCVYVNDCSPGGQSERLEIQKAGV